MMTFARTGLLAGALALVSFSGAAFVATGAFAAEPIVGKWRRDNGTIIRFSGSGSRFCGKVLTGKFKGRSIGCMSGKNGKYAGKINVLDEGKTYRGKAFMSGRNLKLRGYSGLFFKTATLTPA